MTWIGWVLKALELLCLFCKPADFFRERFSMRTNTCNRKLTTPSDPTERFKLFYTHTLSLEGGESNDASDPGGITNFGISIKANPELAVELKTGTLSREQAFAHVYDKYYKHICGISS
jgi:hypothetical protein